VIRSRPNPTNGGIHWPRARSAGRPRRDPRGGEILHKSIGLLAPFGRAVVYGAVAGDLTSIPVTSLFPLKTASGFSLLAWRAANPEQARTDIAELTGRFETGQLRAAGMTLPLAEAVQAHRVLEDRTVMGRLILLP
jgi:NADPH:quinone reductase